jgi:hypothetical protein
MAERIPHARYVEREDDGAAELEGVPDAWHPFATAGPGSGGRTPIESAVRGA